MFGSGRFTKNGGKVNILIRPMQENICGYYIDLDIYATVEVDPLYEYMCGYNYDHAIININSIWVYHDIDYTLSTLAHEYQHQIVATDWIEYHPKGQKICGWLNESMSAFAEDMVYPGIKTDNGYSMYMYLSSRFTKGQSLYSFDTTDDDWIGAYGAVWLFAQYLSEAAGD